MAQVYKSENGEKWVVRFYHEGKKVEIRNPSKVGMPEKFWSVKDIPYKRMKRLGETIQLKYEEEMEKAKSENELPNLPFGELCKQFLLYKEGLVSAGTFRAAKSIITNHVAMFFGNDRIRDSLTRNRLSQYRTWLSSAGLTTNMKNQALSKFSEMIEYFTALGYATPELLSGATAFLKPFRQERTAVTARDFWTKEEWETFISTIKDFRMKVLYEVAYWCALRINELLGLKYSDFDFEEGTVYIQRQKLRNGKEGLPKTASSVGKVKVRKEALEDVKKLKEMDGGNGGYIFEISDTSLRLKFDADIKKAGVKRIVFHGLRHSMATRMLWSGLNPTQVSHHLRHANPSITMQVYVHFIPGNDKEAIDKI